MRSRDTGNRAAIVKINRRAFLAAAGLAGGGLTLGVLLGCSPERASDEGADVEAAGPAPFAPNAYVQISEEGIVIYAPNPEIGQGVKTSLPMIVAEELDAAWEDVEVIAAPTDPSAFGLQMIGGSTSTAARWLPLRQAGAAARHMLLAAAALRWEVDVAECETRDSRVIHVPSGRELSYLALASAAAELPVPDVSELVLKPRSEFRLLGKRIGGVDNGALVTGEPLFGIDQRLPDMVYATYVRCPAIGGVVRSANVDEVRKLPGVVDAFIVERNAEVGDGGIMPREFASLVAGLEAGVAIVAQDTWSAFKARDSLRVEWDESAAAKDSWSAARERARVLGEGEGNDTIANTGDAQAAFDGAAKTLSAFYEYAFVSHAQLEPHNVIAWWREGAMEIWTASQFPLAAQGSAAALLGIDIDAVILHPQRAGGGFGRRGMHDAVLEAVAIARRIDRPVKLTWMREDDMAQDYYRAGGFHALAGALDDAGQIVGWRNHFISFTRDGVHPVVGGSISGDIDPGPFVPNYRITQTLLPWRTPCGPWRAPGSNVIAFAHQSFLHELSVAAGRDHLAFLLELLGEPRWLDDGNPQALHTGRAAGVLRLAADKAGWGRSLPQGRGLGLAFFFSHGGHVAEVAEVDVDRDRQVNVRKVTVAVDVGPIVNLSGAENQVQGAVIDGYSAMLGQQMTFENGRALETNFHRYPLLRMHRAPEVHVHFIESDFPPTGLGEPALPPLAPAVGNAIFAATGERVRTLPIVREGWR